MLWKCFRVWCCCSSQIPDNNSMNVNGLPVGHDVLCFFPPFVWVCFVYVCGSVIYYSSCHFCNQNWHLWFVDIICEFSGHLPLQCFDMNKIQRISNKKKEIKTNCNIVALLNSFLGMNPPHWQTRVATPPPFFFCPISTTFSSSDGQCWGCVEVEWTDGCLHYNCTQF